MNRIVRAREVDEELILRPDHFPGNQYPRLQILTIKELLEGKEAQYPRMAPPITFKRAQRHRRGLQDQQRLV